MFEKKSQIGTNDFTSATRVRGRLNAEEAGQILGFPAHDIPILVAARLLKPLGSPTINSVKYFAAVYILELSENPEWLDKATKIVSKHWMERNEKARKKKTSSDASEIVDKS